MKSGFPRRPDEVTVAWLEEALRASESIPSGASVSSIEIEPIGGGFGQTSETVRVKANLAATGNGVESGQISVIGKFATTDEHRLGVARRTGFYLSEVNFYRTMAHRVSTRVPRCYAADIGPDGGSFVLLLEDFPDHRPGDEVIGLNPVDAELAVAQIAGLHTPFWNDPNNLSLAAFPPSLPSDVLGSAWDTMMETFGAEIPPEIRQLREAYLQSAASLHAWATSGPSTIVHGDFRLDNMLFGSPGSENDRLVVIDWQGISVRRGITDFAYLISHSMPVEQRREFDMSLLATYVRELNAGGIDYSEHQALDDYKIAMLYLIFIVLWITGVHINPHERAMRRKRALVNRAFTAILDHGSDQLLPFSIAPLPTT